MKAHSFKGEQKEKMIHFTKYKKSSTLSHQVDSFLVQIQPFIHLLK